MLLLLVFPGIVFFMISMCRPRRTLRDHMDTTPTDMRRADDGKGYGSLEDPSTTWTWATNWRAIGGKWIEPLALCSPEVRNPCLHSSVRAATGLERCW